MEMGKQAVYLVERVEDVDAGLVDGAHNVVGRLTMTRSCRVEEEEVLFSNAVRQKERTGKYGTARDQCHPHTNIVKLEKVAGGIKSTSDIWAIGDVTNRINLTPVAIMEAMCFAKTEFAGNPRKPNYVNVASAVFCQPPLSVVGLTEEQRFLGICFHIQCHEEHHFWAARETVMKLIVDANTDKVLGAAVLGPHAAEIIQGIAIALKLDSKRCRIRRWGEEAWM